MPDFHVSPISIVNQIKSNLQDRYDSGYPILKELLQNADDAGARRFRLDALSGWPDASNPLLRGPGLLVVNDGIFRKNDERGITSFGESSKAIDSAAIGKFGLGQKAVFHLCDAFVVYAYGDNEPFSTVVNPFLGVDVDGNISRDWEPPSDGGLVDTDLSRLRRELSIDFPDRCLALWLPFRRQGLQPAPGVGFSSNFPSASETIADLVNPDDLRVLLTALRHLESVEIREHGETRCAIGVEDVRGRLLGPKHCHTGTRFFGGTIKTRPDQSIGQFVGREASAHIQRHRKLVRDDPPSHGTLKRLSLEQDCVAMIFKLTEAAEKSWRRLDGYNQLPKVILGVKFTDGIEVVKSQAQAAAA